MVKTWGTEADRDLPKMSELVPRPMPTPQWLQGLSHSHHCSASGAVLPLSGLSSYLCPLWMWLKKVFSHRRRPSCGQSYNKSWVARTEFSPSPLTFHSENNISFQKPRCLHFYFGCSFPIYRTSLEHNACLWSPNKNWAMPISSSQLQYMSSTGHLPSAYPAPHLCEGTSCVRLRWSQWWHDN